MSEVTGIGRLRRAFGRDLWVTLAPAMLLVVVAFALTLVFLKPAPPTHLVLGFRDDEGGYGWFAKKYQQELAKSGVTVELRPVAGDDTLSRLADDASGIDVAFVEGGLVDQDPGGKVVSLGSLYFEPLWIFHRGDEADDPAGLLGRRIAVGPEDSGTRALALELLHAAGADGPPTVLVPDGREKAVAELLAGTIDAAFVVAPAEAPFVQKLAAAPGIHVMSFARADAWVRRFPFLSKRVVPRGLFDLAHDVPAHDLTVVSPTAVLAAKSSLHPALAYLLMRAATDLHGGARLLASAGEFPSAGESGLPLSDEARRFYKSGPPLLQRYLPFWLANLVDRLWLMLVPLLAVMLPLARAVPPLYRWRVRSRIYRWYARLKEVELLLDEGVDPARLGEMLATLEEVERAVNRVATPLAYADQLYAFREHLDLVRRRVERRVEAGRLPAARSA